MSVDYGGPAFPQQRTGNIATEQYGMSLRDYFAAKALAGICGDGIPGGHHKPERTAEEAYRYADAMLAERQK